jgi:hypothetical protein
LRNKTIKGIIAEKTKKRWQAKRMYGQMPFNLDEKLVDNEQSYRRLNLEDIKGQQHNNNNNNINNNTTKLQRT